ncbi:hypothetical protein FQN54_003885 [Arachnomyces sp. PD_36]|nr:hypothetical protein FQN54_003885 [Arachnomyces sp. PD_36]
MTTARKVFHCVVDETILTTNISEIKKWCSNGGITLIVPLYTLERLHALKKANSQVGMNAREAVRFLDRVTSGKDSIPPERVVLQGPMEQYEKWSEAERYFLPEFEEEVQEETNADGVGIDTDAEKTMDKVDAVEEVDPTNDLSQMLLNKLNFKKDVDANSITSAGTRSGPVSPSSSRSSNTSPECTSAQLATDSSPKKDAPVNGHCRSKSNSIIPPVPAALKPLLSSILWRLHENKADPSSSVNGCILITNDRTKQEWAQKFGVATKNVHQLRTAILYEEKEYKNRCKYIEKTQPAEPKPLLSYENDSDEDELVFIPRGRGKSSVRGSPGRNITPRKPSQTANAPNVEKMVDVPSQPIDPDSFNRSIGTVKKPVVEPSSPSRPSRQSRGTGGGSRGNASNRRGAPRGNARGGGSGRGRGKLWVP